MAGILLLGGACPGFSLVVFPCQHREGIVIVIITIVIAIIMVVVGDYYRHRKPITIA